MNGDMMTPDEMRARLRGPIRSACLSVAEEGAQVRDAVAALAYGFATIQRDVAWLREGVEDDQTDQFYEDIGYLRAIDAVGGCWGLLDQAMNAAQPKEAR